MTFDGLYLQRFIIILLVIFIIISILKKAGKFACFCISILCLMQMGYFLSSTSVNDTIPLDKYFKYDVVKSITSIWNETDKEALKANVSKGINKTADLTEGTLNTASDIAKKYINDEPISISDFTKNKEKTETNEPETSLEDRLP